MPLIAELDDLTFSYGNGRVLDGVSLRLSAGELVALVGPNGSGKSTLLKLLVGTLRPDGGTARLFGHDPTRRRAGGRLGYVPQRPSLATGVTATVEDVAVSGRLSRTGWGWRLRAADREAVDAALAAVGLADRRGERVASLSGGQQQRAFVARALAGEPELLVLDEPIAGVDAESQRSFRTVLVDLVGRGGTVLLVSHELGAVADDLDRVVVLKQRVRFDGPPADLASSGVSLGVHDSDLPVWLEGIS